MYSYIVNPLTNKKISIFSKNGKKVLKHFIYQLQFGGDDLKKEGDRCESKGPLRRSNCEPQLNCYTMIRSTGQEPSIVKNQFHCGICLNPNEKDKKNKYIEHNSTAKCEYKKI